MEGKVVVTRAQSCYEVVLEGSYGSFRCVAAVDVRWSYLIEVEGNHVF